MNMKLANLATFFKKIFLIGIILFNHHAYSQSNEIPKEILDQYNDVMNYVKKIRTDEKFNPPEPPSFYIDYCYPCDKARQKKYVDDSAHFVDTYFAEEKPYIKKGAAVLQYVRQALLVGLLPDTTYLSGDMIEAAVKISQKIQRKMTAAWNKYSPLPEKVHFLAKFMSELDRNMGIVGGKSDMPDFGVLRKREILATIHQITEAREKLNYRILLNTPFIFEVFREAALLDLTPEDMGDYIGNYFSVSKFKFTVKTNASVIGPDGTTFMASLTGEDIYIAKPGKDCQLVWKPADTAKPKMVYALNEISIRIPKPQQPVFNGDRRYTSPPAKVKLDFCDDQKDRDNVHLYGFITGIGLAVENWTLNGRKYPGAAVLTAYAVSFPDTRQYTEMQPDDVPVNSGVPFGFYLKQKPVNEEEVIFDQRLDAKKTSPSPQHVQYGEITLKIEHVEKKVKPRTS